MKKISESDIRQELASWDQARLLDFILELVGDDGDTRRKLERLVLAKRDSGAVAGQLIRQRQETKRPRSFSFTEKQGQYLAYIVEYSRVHRQPPSEPDMVRYFAVSPPVVHQMVKTLDRLGLIQRVPGQARTIQVCVPTDQLPTLVARL